MPDRSGPEDLLQTARRVLREDIAPSLDSGARYQALMAANAMAIALRQIAAQGRPPVDAAPVKSALELQGDGDELTAELARAIRAGRAAPGGSAHAVVRGYLMEQTRRRLAESNPKLLDP